MGRTDIPYYFCFPGSFIRSLGQWVTHCTESVPLSNLKTKSDFRHFLTLDHHQGLAIQYLGFGNYLSYSLQFYSVEIKDGMIPLIYREDLVKKATSESLPSV